MRAVLATTRLPGRHHSHGNVLNVYIRGRLDITTHLVTCCVSPSGRSSSGTLPMTPPIWTAAATRAGFLGTAAKQWRMSGCETAPWHHSWSVRPPWPVPICASMCAIRLASLCVLLSLRVPMMLEVAVRNLTGDGTRPTVLHPWSLVTMTGASQCSRAGKWPWQCAGEAGVGDWAPPSRLCTR